MNDTSLCFLKAVELAHKIRSGEISALETMQSHLAQIEKVNPQVNAIVTLLPEMAMEAALKADEKLARGEEVGPLHGLPVAHKDLVQTKGIRTTFGSLVYEDFIPEEDSLLVERLREAGAILLGKTNTPEFAHDVNTTNQIFGTTRNPFNVNVTAGGSSGGSGSAVAANLAPIALGTDLGGSIRVPCSYNSIVGLRPSPGRVPVYPTEFGWDTLVEHVQGPMTRSVADLGLAMSVLAGPDDRDPSSLPASLSVIRETC